MKTNFRILTFAALTLATLAPGEGPRFAPEEGTTLSRHLVLESQLELQELSATLNGEEVEGPPDSWAMSVSNQLELRIADRLGAVADGRMARMERSFTAISRQGSAEQSAPDMEPSATEITMESPLEGESVVFTWDPDAERYQVTPLEEDADLDEDLLAGLTQDLDFAALLSRGDVEVGATWEIDGALLLHYFPPCGDLGFEVEWDGEEDSDGLALMAVVLSPFEPIDECKGTLRATLTAVDAETKRASIALAGELELSADYSALLRERWEAIEGPGENRPNEFAAKFQLELEGELQWDLAHHHMHSLTLSGDQTVKATVGGTENGMVVEMNFEFAGSYSMSVTLE